MNHISWVNFVKKIWNGSCVGGCRGCDVDYYPIQNNDNLRKQLMLINDFPSSPSSSISPYLFPGTDNFERTIKINREREKKGKRGGVMKEGKIRKVQI
jgi:hypothetical protein